MYHFLPSVFSRCFSLVFRFYFFSFYFHSVHYFSIFFHWISFFRFGINFFFPFCIFPSLLMISLSYFRLLLSSQASTPNGFFIAFPLLKELFFKKKKMLTNVCCTNWSAASLLDMNTLYRTHLKIWMLSTVLKTRVLSVF